MMDRSFLSQPEVVAASRRFVCARLATYEDPVEDALLRSIFVGRSGQLENTVFAILSPDGRLLVRPGRSPGWAFRDASDMAAGMDAIAARYGGQAVQGSELPAMSSVRLALNVAACDRVPLVALVRAPGQPSAELALERQLAGLAWSPSLLGQAVYARATVSELQALGIAATAGSVVVVEPEAYGMQGRLQASFAAPQLQAGPLQRALQACHLPLKDPHEHMRQGRVRGIYWQTATPVTDDAGGRGRP